MKKIRLPSLSTLFRTHFVSGLLILTPLAVIVWILSGFMRFLWSLQGLLPEALQPALLSQEHPVWSLFVRLGLSLSLATGLIFIISLLGWISGLYLGKKILEVISDLIQHIPVVRSVYSALDQMLRAFGSGGGKQFNRVVYLEYPRPGIWTLGFVTGNAKISQIPERSLNVFVPTTPNPTGGFYLIVPESQVRDANIGVEDAFRTILSLGVAQGHSPEKSERPKERGNG